VNLDQESQLLGNPVFLAIGRKVTGQAGWTSWDCKAIIPGQLECVVHQIVELLAKPPITAIDSGRLDSVGVILYRAFEEGLACVAVHGY
jgi:hypothetical protein